MKNNNRKATIKTCVSRRKVVHHVISMSPAQYILALSVIHEYMYMYINIYLYVNKEAREKGYWVLTCKMYIYFIRYKKKFIIKIVHYLLMLLWIACMNCNFLMSRNKSNCSLNIHVIMPVSKSFEEFVESEWTNKYDGVLY